MSDIGEMDLEAAAKQAAGNWAGFKDFSWHLASELDSPGDWCIAYTRHRDSGLLDQSNAAAMEREMHPFTEGDDPDVVAEHHHHWAVGWIEGFSIRVFRDGQITAAFAHYHELAQRLNDYAVLDDEDYSRRQYEATSYTTEHITYFFECRGDEAAERVRSQLGEFGLTLETWGPQFVPVQPAKQG